MQVKPSVFGSATVALALSFAVAALAQGTAPVALTADKMKWSSQGGLALPGLEQVSLVGDPSKPGPYTIRLKFPAGYKLAPHTHPDPREVTILSGTWYTGYGEQAESRLAPSPAGRKLLHGARQPSAFCRGARSCGHPGERRRPERSCLRGSPENEIAVIAAAR